MRASQSWRTKHRALLPGARPRSGRCSTRWEISTRATCRALVEARPCLHAHRCWLQLASRRRCGLHIVSSRAGTRKRWRCSRTRGDVAFVAGQACCEVPMSSCPRPLNSLGETSSRFSRCRLCSTPRGRPPPRVVAALLRAQLFLSCSAYNNRLHVTPVAVESESRARRSSRRESLKFVEPNKCGALSALWR